MYTLKSCQKYTVDKWYNKIQSWQCKSISSELYYPSTTYKLFELSRSEVNNLLIIGDFTADMKENIKQLFPAEYFFKISNRSPKDILEKEIEILDEDHRSIKLEKKIKQLSILKVDTVEKVIDLILKSERVIEDFKLYLQEEDVDSLYLVFQPWRPNLGIGAEYRCFINNRKLVGVCLYKPEYYSTRHVIPLELIVYFINQLLEIIDYDRFVVDVFELDSKIYFIEINPFEEFVDTFSFDWEIINNTNTLLITL